MSKICASLVVPGLVILGLCLAATAPVKAEDVLVTQYKGDPTGAPFAIAIEKGFFKKAGIDVTNVLSGQGGGASLRAAMASPLGFGEVSPAGAIAAIQQGQDIRIVGIGSRLLDLNLVVMPNSSIKTLKDLNGKTFAISNPKSLTELTAVLVAEKAGLKPDAMKRVALGSLGGAITALEKGVADVTAIPAVVYRVKHGDTKYRTILGPKDMPDLPPGIEIATGKLMKEHPDKLRAMLAGRRAGVKYIYEHTDDAIKILAKLYAPLPADKVAEMVHELAAAKFWSEGNFEMRLLETAQRAMLDVGMLKSKVDLKKMIDASFLPSDLQKLQ
jgi:NitT/TauT family transport system substrate-binding protein